MDTVAATTIVETLGAYSGEAISFIQFLGCASFILIFFRFYGLAGLYIYGALATVLANIQVLKLGRMSLTSEPVALGTVTFASIFLVTDIITEHYGARAARRHIGISFLGQLMATLLMLITLGFSPVPGDVAHTAMTTLFLASSRLLVASLSAFVVSQLCEILVFQGLRQLWEGRHLWFRTNVSTLVAALLDNVIFSVLAWVVLAPEPVDWHTLIFTYILATYIARIGVSVLSTPIIYLTYLWKAKI